MANTNIKTNKLLPEIIVVDEQCVHSDHRYTVYVARVRRRALILLSRCTDAYTRKWFRTRFMDEDSYKCIRETRLTMDVFQRDASLEARFWSEPHRLKGISMTAQREEECSQVLGAHVSFAAYSPSEMGLGVAD